MRFILLFLGSGSLVSVLLLGLTSFCPEFMNDMGLNFAELPGLLKMLREEEQRHVVLDAKSKEIRDQMNSKDQVARDLASGRLTLLQAAARFRDLSQAYPTFGNERLQKYPGKTVDEQLCRYVIGRVECVLLEGSMNSAKNSVEVKRLNLELQQLLQYGDIYLP